MMLEWRDLLMIHEGGGEKEKREMDQLCSPDGKEEEERGKSSTTGRGYRKMVRFIC